MSEAQQNASAERDEFVDALKHEGDEGIKKAFHVLSKGLPTTPLRDVDLKSVVAIRGVEIPRQYAEDMIQQVNKQDLFTCDEFVCIVKLLEEPGEEDQTKKIHAKLMDIGEQETIILCGRAGVGKTWAARQVANLAVRKGDFDAAIWVYLNRIHRDDDTSLHESIAYQLSVLDDFEDAEADKKAKAEEAKKKAKAEEAKKKEPDRKAVGLEEIAKEAMKIAKEPMRKREEIEKLIVKKLDSNRNRILFVLDGDGDGSRMEAEVVTEMKKVKDESGDGKKNADEQGDGKKSADEEDDGEKSADKEGDGEKSADKEGEGKKKADKEEEKKIVVLKLSVAGKVVVRLELGVLASYKVMKTARKDQLGEEENGVIVKPFNWGKSKSLAAQAMDREEVEKSLEAQAMDREEVKKSLEAQAMGREEVKKKMEELQELARYFMFRSERLPSQLLLISRIVSYFGKKGELGLQKLRNDRDTLKKGGEGVSLLDVLIKGYEERLPKSVLIDCYGPDTPKNHFMRRGRAVSFNEVICYWIMEGHLGPCDRVDEAYHKGHCVLMELMDCGLLQKQEADYVAPSGATTFTFHIDDYKDFFNGIRPGIGITFDMSLGSVALADGMIRTISSSRYPQIISTLLLDGNRIGQEERPTETLSEHKDLVEILAISDPTSQHFKLPILEMRNLRLLALRGCQFLDSLEPFLLRKADPEDVQSHPKSDKEKEESNQKRPPPAQISEKLEGLAVLEISGPSLLIKTIPEQLFNLMPNLKTLNLSHLRQVKSLPPSFYLLTQIEFLILRGCENLQELKTIKNFKDLKVLDISDATFFEKFEDKSLHSNTKLQILNLSNTKLQTLPLINQLNNLKFVWLRDCKELPRIRKIDKMKNLQIFDISGSGEVERFCDPSLEDLKNLMIVDISRTKIRRLPADLGDPTYLYVKDCLRLRVVPPVEGLTKLEVLDLSGCKKLREVRTEFFAKVHRLRVLNLSETSVQHLPFLGDRISLRRLLLSGCKLLEKVEKLSCLKELEFLDLSGCEKVMELEEGSFNDMEHLEHLNLSGTGIGGQPLPSLSKLKSLKQLHVRDCPNLTELPGVEEVENLQVLDYSGTVLESPPRFSKDHPPQGRVVGAGIESIDTVDLFRNLGAEQGDDKGANWRFKQEEVTQCKWIISNWQIEAAEKLGTPVYGVHFLRLLKEYPSFLTQLLSKFCFLVYPSEAAAKVEDRFPSKEMYIDELSLRKIYFEQVSEEKMERCLEIREFNNLPENLRPLIAQAQFVVLVDDPFLKSLLDLRVDSTMPMKACWIESCSELEHVVAAPPEVEEKTGEVGKDEGEKKKNGKSVELAKGGGDQRKKVAAGKAREAAGKGIGDQKKNAADGKGEPAKSEDDKSGEPAKGQGNEPKNAAADNSGESAKGEGDQQKNAAEEKSGDATNIGGNEPKNAAADNSGESAKGEGDQQKNAAEEKSGDATKIGGDEPKNAAADNPGESTKGEGDEQKKNAAEEKSGESAKGEGDQQKTTAADEKSGEPAKDEGDQPKNAATADTAKVGGDEQKNAGEEKSGEAAKNEGDQQNATAAETAKIGGDEQKNAAEEKAGVSAKSEGDQQKTTAADHRSGEPAKKESNQPKNAAADDSGESTKVGGDQQKNTAAEKSGEAVKNEGEEAKNLAEDLNMLEILWISDVSKMKSVCGGDIKSMSFKFLKSLYLEYCPELSEICSSSLQLLSLETLFVKYCQKLDRLFTDENPSKMEKLSHLQLWGLDNLQKINCKTPLLRKLRVGECPLLEHVIASRLTDSEVENEGHDNLEILHIKSCDNLKSIFESSQDDHNVLFERLTELELSGLPKLRKVAREALSLRTLRVHDCPSLISIIDGAYGLRDLEKLEVKTCEKMKTIVGGDGTKLEKVKKIELLGLPELERVGAMLPSNKGYIIWACPKLENSDFGGQNDTVS